MPNPSEPTSNSIFALQLQMMAINFTLHAEDKGLGSLLGCPPSLVVPLWLVACLAAWADGSDNKRTTRALV